MTRAFTTTRWGRTGVAAMVGVGAFALSIGEALPAHAYVTAHCYATAAHTLEVCHDYTTQQGLYFNTPADEVAYNIQQLQVGAQVVDVFHTESLKSHDPNCVSTIGGQNGLNSCATGDSTKVAVGTDPHQMPATRSFVLWGQYTDSTKYNYYGAPDGVGGAGNPMTVAGVTGDPYYYTYFLDTRSDNLQSTANTSLYRDQLELARTSDLSTWQVLAQTPSGEQWQTEASTVNPVPIVDAAGKRIQSNNAMTWGNVQGLIGSISHVNGVYYYFYTDYVPNTTVPNGVSMQLYYRTATDISHDGAWSAAQPVSTTLLPISLVRVAKDFNTNRWVILYNCDREDTNQDQDLCLQYTSNLNVVGPGGLSDLTLFDYTTPGAGGVSRGLTEDYLGMGIGASDYAEPDWLTDVDGNLPGPIPDITWTDMTSAVYGAPVYWATLTLYNAQQASLSQAGDSAVLTGEVTGPPPPQTACVPAESDPRCFRFDVYTSGALASTGRVNSLLSDQSWLTLDQIDIYQVTAYDSNGRQLGQATHVGTQCNFANSPTGGAVILGSACPITPTPLSIPLSSTPDGHVVFVVLPEQVANGSDFRLDMELDP